MDLNLSVLKSKFKGLAKKEEAQRAATKLVLPENRISEICTQIGRHEAPEIARLQAVEVPTAVEPEKPEVPEIALGLNSLLTMSAEQIQKVSPTGQFSKLKASLRLEMSDMQTFVAPAPHVVSGVCLNDLLTD